MGNMIPFTSTIDPTVSLGHFNVIYGEVIVEKDTVIENFCEIMSRVHIGKNCFIRSYSRIGNDTVIGDNVIVKCSAIITSNIVIEEGVFIGPQAMLLAEVKRTSESRIHIKKGAIIGAGAKILPGLTIGEGAIVGANTFVNRSVGPGETVIGSPARKLR